MKKGFTLIELLAVIVILAIIALIATPIVLDIIKDSTQSANLRSAEMYLDAVEQAISIEKMNNIKFNPNTCEVIEEGNLLCDNKDRIDIKVTGGVPKKGSIITFEKGKIKDTQLQYQNVEIVKNDKGNLEYKNYKYLNNYQHKHVNGTIEKHEVTFNNDGHGICSKCKEEVLSPGIYNESGIMTKSWQQLLDEETIYVIDGKVTTHINLIVSGSNPSSDKLNGKLVIADGVTIIDSNAFAYCYNLTSVIMPNTVTSIDNSAFGACTNLKSVIIPSSVTNIAYNAFYSCRGLESIIVDKDNTVYDSRNDSNAIIETATNSIVCGCKNTIIPTSVVAIKRNAFYGLSNMTSITIPANITSIEDYAFSYCTGLKNINYEGTTEQWNQISKGSSWNIDAVEMTVNCTNGNITVPKKETAWSPFF